MRSARCSSAVVVEVSCKGFDNDDGGYSVSSDDDIGKVNPQPRYSLLFKNSTLLLVYLVFVLHCTVTCAAWIMERMELCWLVFLMRLLES